MADRTLAEFIADAERAPAPGADDEERSSWLEALAGTTGAINRLQRKLKGKKKPDEGRPANIGIRG